MSPGFIPEIASRMKVSTGSVRQRIAVSPVFQRYSIPATVFVSLSISLKMGFASLNWGSSKFNGATIVFDEGNEMVLRDLAREQEDNRIDLQSVCDGLERQ